MAEIAKKIPKKRWLYVVPVIFLINIFSFMDRQVISFALPTGLAKDLALNASMAGFAAGVFSLGLIFLQIYSGQLAQKGRVKTLFTIAVFGWSIMSVLTAFVQTPIQLYVVRFILGVFEGALTPAMMMFISNWFPDKDGERNRATSAYFTANAVAMTIMGPISGAIIAYSSWRELFLILGIVSAISAVIWMVMITENPKDAKWLSKEEKEYIINTINEEREIVKKASGVTIKSDKVPFKILLRNKYVWILCIMGFLVTLGQFGYGMWTPTMIKNITKAGILGVGFLVMIPNLLSLIGLWVCSYFTKINKDRRLSSSIPMVILGFMMFLGTFFSGNAILGVVMVCLASFFIQGWMPGFFTIPSLVFVKELEGPARGLIGICMSLGSFFGPYAVGLLTTLVGSINAGIYFLAIMLTIAFIVSFKLPKNIGAGEKLAAKHPE